MLQIKNDKAIAVISDRTVYVFPYTFPFIDEVIKAIDTNNESLLVLLSNINDKIINGEVEINENGLSVNGINLEEKFIKHDKVLMFINKLKNGGLLDKDTAFLKPFIKNMFDNPYIDAVEELYDFCQEQDFVITEDGCFLAYKNVNSDFTSIHPSVDGTHLDHSIGSVVKEQYFDTDRTQTCSKGLHFCSKEYLKHYTGNKTIIVKVNPKDVVAIPTDYSFMKGRCKEYKVIGELNKEETLKEYYIKNH